MGGSLNTSGIITVLFKFLKNLVVKTSLQAVWTLMNSLQVIVNLPLISVRFPKAVIDFTMIFNNLSSFDILPHKLINQQLFTFNRNDEPLRLNFDAAGYSVTNAVSNSESVFWFLVLYFFGSIFCYVLFFRIKWRFL